MWIYKDKEVLTHDDLIMGCTDIVYMIHYEDGGRYIGKKCVMAVRKKPPLVGKKRSRRVLTKLPFAKYQGSHSLADVLEIEYKEILYQCSSKKSATYLESALLFHHDAVFDSSYLNENIGGTFYRNSLEGLLT